MSLAPVDALDDVADERIRASVPFDEVTSLRHLEFLYGALYTLATAGNAEYAQYLTPNEAQAFLGEPETLIAARIDVSGPNPSFEGVHATTYDESMVAKAAHCRYAAAANGIDHSVTHQAGQTSSTEKLADYVGQRLHRWATNETVQTVVDDHNQGWIVAALAELGQDEAVIDAIETEVTASIAREGAALLTVQVRTADGGEWRWPGDVDVFNEAMKRRRLKKFVSKGDGATDSRGRGTCLIYGDERELVGTPDDPLNYYLAKQTERFPNFDANLAWTSHPLSGDAALTVLNAAPFIDACSYSTLGVRLYYLPHFPRELTADRMRALYRLLATLLAGEGEGDAPLTRTYERAGRRADDLRFYATVVIPHQDNRYDVVGESAVEDAVYPVVLRDAHATVLASEWFNTHGAGAFHAGFDTPLLDEYADLLDAIGTGEYFARTFPDRKEEDQNNNAPEDDPRVQAVSRMLRGEVLQYDTLLSQYVERLHDHEGEDFPTWLVTSQFAQLCALGEADLLTGPTPDSQPTLTMTDTETDGTTSESSADTHAGARREAALAAFIDTHPPLREDPERRGAFLIGVLLGNVSRLQNHPDRDLGRTIADAHPPTGVSKASLKRVATDALNKNDVYASEDGYLTQFAEVTTRLTDALQHSLPTEWSLSTDDVRFHYALGIAYGKNQGATGTTDEADAEPEAPTAE